MSRSWFPWLCLALCLFVTRPAGAGIVAIPDETAWIASLDVVSEVDFEAFTGPVSNEYPGIVFFPFNGGVPSAVEQFSHSGANSVFTVAPQEGGGGWTAELDVPVRGFSLWTGDVEFNGTIITFYDSASNLLGSFDLLETGAGNGPLVYGFCGFMSDAADIARVELTIDSADAVWCDDVRFGLGETAGISSGGGFLTQNWGGLKRRFHTR